MTSASNAAAPTVKFGSVLFVCTIVGFVGLTLWLAAVLNIYIDEAYSLHTTDHGLGYALAQSLDFEQQPPLYFLLLAIWRSIYGSLFFARLTSIACAVATLFVVRDFAKRYLRNIPDWLPSLVVASNPFTLWATVELRVYSLIILISAALISAFFRAYFDDRPLRRNDVVFGCIAIAGVYTQYFFVATLMGLGLVVLAFARRRLIPYSLTMLVTILALLPMVGILRHQMHDASVEALANPPALAAAMLSTVASFALPHVWINALDIRPINGMYIVIFLAMTVLAIVGLRRNRIVAALAIVTGTVTAFFLALILVEHEPIEMPRHITTVFIPTVFMVIAGVSSSFGHARRRNVLALYLAIYAICSAAEDAHTYRALAKVGDWTRVALYLERNARPSEPIVVFDAENALPLRYSYQGVSPIVPIPSEQQFDHFDRRDFAIKNQRQLVRAIPKAARLWLVVQDPCRYVQLGDSCNTLETYVRTHYAILTRMQFFETAVYELKPDA